MRLLAATVLSAGVAVFGDQTAVRTIELPALDRARIAFRVDATPMVVLGPTGVPGATFSRVNDVVRFSDGSIALATSWGFSSLHLVDPGGRVTRIGDFKRGVGDTSLQDICPAGDRLLVMHSRTRYTIFNLSGAVESTGSRPDNVTMLCPMSRQRAWMHMPVRGFPSAPTEQPHEPGVRPRRSRVALRLFDLAGEPRPIADLGEFDAADYYPVGPTPRTQGASRPPVYGWRSRPFARDLRVAVDGSSIHTGDGTTWEVRTWDPSGRLARILRVTAPAERVTTELRAAFIDEHFAGSTADFRKRSIQQERLDEPSTFPDVLPAFADLKVDRVGRLWVRRYPKPNESTQEWWVFSSEAAYLGRVDLPSPLIVDDIGEDYVAGSYLVRSVPRPESDAISDVPDYDVRVYRLRAPAGSLRR